jgi:SAM-dependent methyltransferase
LRLYKQLTQEKTSTSKSIESIVLYPCIWDATTDTPIEPSYFYQDSWAFDLIVKAKPRSHIDIGSHHKYVALLSKVVPLTMVDLRPLSLEMESIRFVQGTILDLPFSDNSIESLSSLCVIEHIGLGRYGDPLDPLGSLKACNELARVIKPGGNLYISVPIEDNPKTYFNAHRSFREEKILGHFSQFSVQDKSYIYGNSFTNQKRPCFGVGCYHLRKFDK